MKQPILLVLLFLFFGVTDLRSQNEKLTAEEKEKQELRQKFQQGMQAHTMHRVHSQAVAVKTNKYNQHETEILNKLNAMSIPDDFPVYKEEYTDEQYIILMNKWYQANPTLLRNPNTNEQK